MSGNNQQLERLSKPNSLAKVDIGELHTLAKMAFDSGMFPDLTSAAQAGMKILAGRELGFDPIVSMTGIHFFQGKVVVGATLLASLVKDSGKYEYKVLEHTNQKCSIQFTKLFNSEWKPMGVPVTYTIKDAQDAGLATKDVWKKHPADMLFATCVRKGARRYCPDLLRGMSSQTSEFDDAEVAAEIPSSVLETETVEPNAIDADFVDVPTEPDFLEGVQIDELREAVIGLLEEKAAGDKKEKEKILNGRVVEKMELEALRSLYGDLQAL